MNTIESSARDNILAKLRGGRAEAATLFRSQDDSEFLETVPTAVTTVEGSGLAFARAFGENLESVLGTYEIIENTAEVPYGIARRIEGWRAEHGGGAYGEEILSWAPEELPVPNLSTHLEELGLSLFVPSELHDKEERSHAASLSVGLTGVDAAFAGTGSMVLIPGPGKSRAASLLPLHHIALVPILRIYSSMESWLAKLRSDGTIERVFREHAQLAFITGPSKSADIELNLTLGVHGPRDVHAILIADGREGRE